MPSIGQISVERQRDYNALRTIQIVREIRGRTSPSHFFRRLGSSASRLWLHRARTFALEPDPRPQQQSEPTFFVGGSCREFSSAIGISCLRKIFHIFGPSLVKGR